MLRKALCYIILIAMIVHCAGRIGVISYLYQKRHSIAYSFGIIAEIPIAMCGSHYDFGKGIKVETSEDTQNVPGFAQAQEINLFFVAVQHLPASLFLYLSAPCTHQFERYTSASTEAIFHPPLV